MTRVDEIRLEAAKLALLVTKGSDRTNAVLQAARVITGFVLEGRALPNGTAETRLEAVKLSFRMLPYSASINDVLQAADATAEFLLNGTVEAPGPDGALSQGAEA